MATLNLSRLKEALTKALTPWFLGREQNALIEAMKTAGEETLLAVDVDTTALQAQLTNLYSNAGAGAIGTVSGLDVEDSLALKIPLTQKGAINGVATLGSDGLLTTSQIPDITITDTFTAASQAAMLALVAQKGDVAIRTDLNKTYVLAASPATTLANWKELLTPTDSVTSVFSRSGVVTAQTGDYTKAQVGLGNVDNTSDLSKPVSTATQTALNLKASRDAVVSFSDITTSRTATPTTGYVYYGNTGTRYMGWDGSNFIMSAGGGIGNVWYAGNFDPATKYTKVGGSSIGPSATTQGFEFQWNTAAPGSGRNEYINNFGGGSGGHYFYTRSLSTDALVLRQSFNTDGSVTFTGNFTAGARLKGGAWPASSQHAGIFHADMPTADYMIISGGSTDPNTYISTMATAGGNVIIRPNGNVSTYATQFTNTGIVTETNYQRRNAAGGGTNMLPRIFMQSGDPGTAAADGDLWFW